MLRCLGGQQAGSEDPPLWRGALCVGRVNLLPIAGSHACLCGQQVLMKPFCSNRAKIRISEINVSVIF